VIVITNEIESILANSIWDYRGKLPLSEWHPNKKSFMPQSEIEVQDFTSNYPLIYHNWSHKVHLSW